MIFRRGKVAFRPVFFSSSSVVIGVVIGGAVECKPLQWIDHNPYPATRAPQRRTSPSAQHAMSVTPAHCALALARRLPLIAAACLAVSACSTFNNATGSVAGLVSPYKVEVVQGNFVSKEQRDALQIGMPRAQVRDILGSPLVASTFHADRWEYVFTIRRQGQEPQQRKLTTFFKGDELAKVESDELISEEDFVTSLSANRKLGRVPLLEVPQDVLREFGFKNSVPNTATAGTNTAQAATNTVAPSSYPPLEAPGAVTSVWDASTQRAVSASSSALSTTASAAPAAANAPLLSAQAPVPAARAPSAAPATAPSPASAPLAQAAPVAPAPAAQPIALAPAVQSVPATAQTPVLAQAPAPVSAVASVARPPAAAPAAAQAAPSPVATPQPAPSANVLSAADPDITAFLNRWTSDWQSRNATAYFSHYLSEFKGTSATRAEWEALRRTRIEGRSRISVAASDVRVRMVSPTEARLVFRQVYESDAFNEIGTKAMFLVKRDGRWLIEREFFTPAQ